MSRKCCKAPDSFRYRYPYEGQQSGPEYDGLPRSGVWESLGGNWFDNDDYFSTEANTKIITTYKTFCNCISSDRAGIEQDDLVSQFLFNWEDEENYYYLEVPIDSGIRLPPSFGGKFYKNIIKRVEEGNLSSLYEYYDTLGLYKAVVCYDQTGFTLNSMSDNIHTRYNYDININQCGAKIGYGTGEVTNPVSLSITESNFYNPFIVRGGGAFGFGTPDDWYPVNLNTTSGCYPIVPHVSSLPQCSAVFPKSVLVTFSNFISLSGCYRTHPLSDDVNWYNFDGSYNCIPILNDYSFDGFECIYSNHNDEKYDNVLWIRVYWNDTDITVTAQRSNGSISIQGALTTFNLSEVNNECNFQDKSLPLVHSCFGSHVGAATCYITVLE